MSSNKKSNSFFIFSLVMVITISLKDLSQFSDLIKSCGGSNTIAEILLIIFSFGTICYISVFIFNNNMFEVSNGIIGHIIKILNRKMALVFSTTLIVMYIPLITFNFVNAFLTRLDLYFNFKKSTTFIMVVLFFIGIIVFFLETFIDNHKSMVGFMLILKFLPILLLITASIINQLSDDDISNIKEVVAVNNIDFSMSFNLLATWFEGWLLVSILLKKQKSKLNFELRAIVFGVFLSSVIYYVLIFLTGLDKTLAIAFEHPKIVLYGIFLKLYSIFSLISPLISTIVLFYLLKKVYIQVFSQNLLKKNNIIKYNIAIIGVFTCVLIPIIYKYRTSNFILASVYIWLFIYLIASISISKKNKTTASHQILLYISIIFILIILIAILNNTNIILLILVSLCSFLFIFFKQPEYIKAKKVIIVIKTNGKYLVTQRVESNVSISGLISFMVDTLNENEIVDKTKAKFKDLNLDSGLVCEYMKNNTIDDSKTTETTNYIFIVSVENIDSLNLPIEYTEYILVEKDDLIKNNFNNKTDFIEMRNYL